MWFLARENSVTRVVGYSTCLQVQLHARKISFFSEIFRKKLFSRILRIWRKFQKVQKNCEEILYRQKFFYSIWLSISEMRDTFVPESFEKNPIFGRWVPKKGSFAPLSVKIFFWLKLYENREILTITTIYFFSFKTHFFHTENGCWKLLVRGGPNLPKSTLRFCLTGVKLVRS